MLTTIDAAKNTNEFDVYNEVFFQAGKLKSNFSIYIEKNHNSQECNFCDKRFSNIGIKLTRTFMDTYRGSNVWFSTIV